MNGTTLTTSHTRQMSQNNQLCSFAAQKRAESTAEKILTQSTSRTSLIPIEHGHAGIHMAMKIRGKKELLAEMTHLSPHLYHSHEVESLMHRELISPLIASSFHGFNSNIITHGANQTGKSSTMWGALTQPEVDKNDASEDQENHYGSNDSVVREEGMIAFALEQLFNITKKEEVSSISYAIGLSVFAINPSDQLIDCLSSSTSLPQTPKLQEDGASKLQITNATKRVIQSKNHAMRILATVLSNSEYRKNHMIVTITIEKKENANITSTQLQFIDLTSGTTLTNGESDDNPIRRSFNPSLAGLDKVVTALSKSVAESSSQPTPLSSSLPASSPRHIPFRESKLTRLLKEGLGNQMCHTHTLFLLCLQGGQHESNKPTVKFAKKLKNIVNIMSAGTNLVLPAHSLHQAFERAQNKMRQKIANVNTPTTPMCAPAPRSEKMSESTTVQITPNPISRVRRQLFDTVPEMATSVISEPIETLASATTEIITPKPSRRYAILSAKSASTNEVVNDPIPAPQSSPVDSSVSPSTRRWKISSAAKGMNGMGSIREDEELNEISSTAPISSSVAPIDATPTRRWTFKAKSATSTPIPAIIPIAPSITPDPVIETTSPAATLESLKSEYEALEERLFEALHLVQSITNERMQSNGSIEENAILMAREATALSNCDMIRAELSALMKQMDELEAKAEVEVAMIPNEDDDEDEREHSFIVDEERFLSPSPSPAPSPTKLIPPTSPAQFQADEVRDAFISMRDTPLRAPNMDGNSRLSIVNESTESVEQEDEISSTVPYEPLPACILPEITSHTISVELNHVDASRDGPSSDSSFICSKLAALMKRSLGLPEYFGPFSRHIRSASFSRTNFPTSTAHINVVNFQTKPETINHAIKLPNLAEVTIAEASTTSSRMMELTTPLANSTSLDSALTPLPSHDPIVNESAALIAQAARLTALRNKQYEESSFMEKIGCTIM